MMGANAGSAQGNARPSVLRRLVIVSDNPLLVEAIRRGFRTGGEFDLVGRADGLTTSAATVLETHPTVILLDDMAQSPRGLGLLRALRAADETVAIIVLSLEVDGEWLEQVIGAGATAVISKATRPAALATLVRETLDGHVFYLQRPETRWRQDVTQAGPDGLPLTNRELEILRLVASGETNREVAHRLWVTQQTVKFHLRNIYRKLGVANRTQASHFAHARGLVDMRATGPAPIAEPVLRVAL